MKNTEELLEYLKKLKSTINSLSDENAQMSVFAFYQVYDKDNEIFNYPSYRINLKTKDIKDYAATLLSKANAVVNKSSEIKEFNYNNNKTTIDFLNLSNTNEDTNKIKNCLNKITVSNTENLSMAKKSASCLCVQIKIGDNNYYLFAKGRPFAQIKQFIFEIDNNDEAKPIKYDLKFPLSLSACIFNNEVYLFSNLVESIFGFENSLREQMTDAMKEIKDTNIFNDESYVALEAYSSKGRNYYCYSNFDKNKLNSLKNGNEYAKDFLNKYNIQKNSQGELVIDTIEKQQMMSKFLCNDLKRDYINIDQVYDAPGNDIVD